MVPFDIPSMSPPSLAVALAALLLSVVYLVFQRRGLPPGPWGIPYLGIWPFLRNETCHVRLDEMKKRYGDVFSFISNGRLFINFGSIKAVREAYITKADCFEQKASGFSVIQYILSGGVGISDGESWKVLRKFFMQALKERGVKAMADTLAGSLHEVVHSTMEELRLKEGEPVDIVRVLANKCTTTLRLTLFGEEMLTDERIRDIVDVYEVMMGGMTPLNTLLVGNIARYCVLPFKSEFRTTMKNTKRINAMLQDIMNEHMSTYNEDHIRDIIDEYIKERNDRIAKGDTSVEHFSDAALASTLVPLIGDGVLAVSYFIFIMVKGLVEHPEDQEKIYQEILNVVGPDRLPSLEDKPNLVFLNAFMMEVIRTTYVFPFIPSMECTKETSIKGYRIPKGAITVVNMWSAHLDPETYDNPQTFDPSRFLSAEGKRRPDLPIAFGVGKRSCLGEGFAMMQIFLFTSALVKNFCLSMRKEEESSFESTGNLNICATPRIHN